MDGRARLARAGALVVIAAFGATGCKGHGREPGHGHGHDDEGGHPGAEAPARAITVWTEKAELFIEHPALIAGQEVGFAAHVTRLPTGKPLTAGTVTVAVKMADGTALAGRADKPLRAGIFRPTIKPPRPGKCEMSVSVAGPQLEDRFAVAGCQVFADLKSAVAALGQEGEGGAARISFLKEQQWTTDFATVRVAERALQPSVAANGEIRPAAGKAGRLSAPASGVVTFPSPPPVLGMAVKKGQLLAALVPRLTSDGDRPSLEAELNAARAELDAAEAQKSRAERLFGVEAIPERQLDEARTRELTARARLSAASGRLAQFRAGAAGAAAGAIARNALQVRAPLAGTLVSVTVTSGQTVSAGDPLFEVIDLRRVWLEARVFEPDIPRVDHARSGWFTLEGYDEPFGIDEGARLVTVGRVVDPRSRTVPVIFELANPDEKLRIGQFAKVHIATGAPVNAPAIPESALVEEGGKSFAFVQVEGEAFERRSLVAGVRSRGWVQVMEGITPGERVVTRGAYEVKLAAASGAIPAHGHAH